MSSSSIESLRAKYSSRLVQSNAPSYQGGGTQYEVLSEEAVSANTRRDNQIAASVNEQRRRRERAVLESARKQAGSDGSCPSVRHSGTLYVSKRYGFPRIVEMACPNAVPRYFACRLPLGDGPSYPAYCQSISLPEFVADRDFVIARFPQGLYVGEQWDTAVEEMLYRPIP
jgi:hypothetical protein